MDGTPKGTTHPQKGDVWTGFEWVSPERYEQLRAGPMAELPPIQPVAGDMTNCPTPHSKYDACHNCEPCPTGDPDNCITCNPIGSRDTTPPGYTDEERARQHKGDIHHYAWRPGDPRDAVELAARFPTVAAELGLPAPAQPAPAPGAGSGVPAYASGGPVGAGKGHVGDAYNYTAQIPWSEEHILPIREGRPLIDRALFRSEMDLVEVIQELLKRIDPNPSRSGIAETPDRVAKAWRDWTSGYKLNAADILKVFEDGAEHCDEMVVVKDIPVYSHCEHHLAPIFGTATVAYLPNGKIVGLSKLSRLVDMHARRLQVQERMTNSIANDLMEHLGPLGCGVVIKARHMCMESRGVKQAGTITVTSALRGAFKDDPAVRAEFLALARQ